MRALLASPTYGPVDPGCVSAIRVALMTAARHGTEWIGDVSPDRMSFMDARNHCAEILMEDPDMADGIMWVDSDMRPRPDSIWRLLETSEKHNLQFLSGLYHSRRGKYRPVFYSYDPAKDAFSQSLVYEPDKITPIGGCGFGFVWTSAALFVDIANSPGFDKDKGGWFPDHHWGNVSEDLGFCRKAIQAGYIPHIDTGVQVGHLGEPEVITRDQYLLALAGPKGVTPVEIG